MFNMQGKNITEALWVDSCPVGSKITQYGWHNQRGQMTEEINSSF